MLWRKILSPIKSRVDEERKRFDYNLEHCQKSSAIYRQRIKDNFRDDILRASSKLFHIQSLYPFYRFEFTLGKKDELLLIACYGDHPDTDLIDESHRDDPRDLTTEVYPFSHNWDLYARLYLT